MKEMNLFEMAAKNKFRFPYRGMISAEDLWDLSVENLDKVFKALNADAKQLKEESLLEEKSQEDAILEAKIAIVKYIVAVKLKESEARAKEREIKEEKQKILSIIAEKQNAALADKSVDELEAMLKKLEEM